MTLGHSVNASDIAWYGDYPLSTPLVAQSLDATRNASTDTTHMKEGTSMAFTMDSRPKTLSKFKRAESLEFRLIFIAAFAVFLVTATVERLLPITWFKAGRKRQSIIEQAKEAANTCAAYAFMG